MAYIRGWVAEPEFELSGVKFDQGKGNLVRVSGIRNIRVEVNRVKMTEEWDKIQGNGT